MKIIAAVDGSPHSEFALELVTRLKLPKSTEVVLLSVVEEMEIGTYSESLRDYIAESVRERQAREAKSLLQLEMRKMAPHFIPIRAEMRDGHAAEQIIASTEEENADLVVMGARGLNAVERFFLGSSSEKVSKYARCSVLIGHLPDQDTEEASDKPAGKLRILICCDGSKASNEAIESLSRLPLGKERRWNAPGGQRDCTQGQRAASALKPISHYSSRRETVSRLLEHRGRSTRCTERVVRPVSKRCPAGTGQLRFAPCCRP